MPLRSSPSERVTHRVCCSTGGHGHWMSEECTVFAEGCKSSNGSVSLLLELSVPYVPVAGFHSYGENYLTELNQTLAGLLLG